MKRFYVGAMLASVASGLTWATALAGPSTVAAKAECSCEVCECPVCDGDVCTCSDCKCTDCGCGK